MQTLRSLAFLLAFLGAFAGVEYLAPRGAFAQAADTDAIQAQIDAINKKNADLAAEIAQYQQQLNVVSGQKQTLQSAIKSIDLSRAQTSTQIKSTQNKIAASNLKIQELSGQISAKEYEIELDRQALGNAIREMAANEDASLIEQLFASGTLADAWTSIDASASVNRAMHENAALLSGAKVELTKQQETAAATKNQLDAAKTDLTTQQRQLDVTKAEKDKLLTQTKSQEATYQQLIAQKRAEQASFESALFQLASQLKGVSDPSAVPASGAGILKWPLATINITQQFGRTSDSGRLYASGTHDGVDFGVPTGTPVKAALSGTVLATNEGAVQNCQYGKWVVVQHANGLSTLYAHLSQISVAKGQSVSTGQVLGYSGMTGYATGPHLHFTVYVSSVLTFKQYTCKAGPTVTIPIAPPSGYLNPLSYL
jgi:murein DD-endopeptidase MepM/ murein hydrolase activator NlpD